MAESKKYYWLKLKRDFFKRHDVRIIEQMPNGKDYVLFYLKMLLESIDHEGQLRFNETIPYNEQMLSVITDTNIDIVKSAMDIFEQLGLVEILDDNTIYMNEVKRMIGSAIDNDNANRQRRFRERKKQGALQKVTDSVTKNNESKRKRIEKELDQELEREGDDVCEQVAALFNSLAPSFHSVKILSDSIKTEIQNSLTKYSLDDFKQLFKKAEKSSFLKGKNKRKWVAPFDWLIQSENIAKVLNGNFDDKKSEYEDFFEKLVAKSWEEKEPAKTAAEDENIKARAEALKQQFAGNG